MQSLFDKNEIGLYFAQLKTKLGSVVRSAHKSGQVQKAQELLKLDGSFTTSKEERMGRWFEHFQSLLNQEGAVGNNIDEYLPLQKDYQTYLDEPFSEEELDTAISQLGKGKATGIDGIPIEVERYCMGDQLKRILLAVFNHTLVTGTVPAAFRDVTISVLYKKGVKSDCNNYRGISIINHHGKLLERLIGCYLLQWILGAFQNHNAVFCLVEVLWMP
jgi:hypothetical protein